MPKTAVRVVAVAVRINIVRRNKKSSSGRERKIRREVCRLLYYRYAKTKQKKKNKYKPDSAKNELPRWISTKKKKKAKKTNSFFILQSTP